MKVPFLNLESVTREIEDDFLLGLKKLLKKGNFILTSEVSDFEKEFAKKAGSKYAVGVSSGADALFLSLTAIGLSRGDEVITNGNAYNASVVSILRAGATPRFADINEDTLTIDAEKIERLITKKTKAILPVHLYGQMNDMEAISKIAGKRKLFVIEDCAQAHGAKFALRNAGTFGNTGAWSFYPTKNLGAFGDAGAVTTDDEKIYEKILSLRNLGQKEKDLHELLGYNMRMDPVQAIALSLKMNFLEKNIEKRRKAAMYYGDLISKGGIDAVPQKNDERAFNSYHLYVVKVDGTKREKLRNFMREKGIGTAIHYPAPVYRQPFFKTILKNKDFCPVSDRVANMILSLPLFPAIKPKEQKYVIDAMKEFFKK